MKALKPPFPIRPTRFRQRLRNAMEAGLYWTGAAGLYVKAFRARGAAILGYHSVPDASIQRWIDPRCAVPLKIFEAQMEFLARRRKVIGMSDLVARLERGESSEPGTVVITFDDGYRDTLELAAPVLERHRFPAIVYLSTGNVTRGENQWIDQLYSTFQCRTNHHLRLDGPDAAHFDLTSEDTVFEAYESIAGRLLVTSGSERKALLEQVKAELRPLERPPRLTLNWEEVKELLRRYPRFEIGVHTREHVDLTSCAEEEARAELGSSIADVAREIEVEAEHFAYPYARSNARVRELVAAESIRSAVVGAPVSLIRRGTDRFAMPRIEVRSAMTRFRFETCGAYPDLPLALLGRS
jgi:peptidoglycan/xylan/chitin deacetylase (PgdA/CDA1 family)